MAMRLFNIRRKPSLAALILSLIAAQVLAADKPIAPELSTTRHWSNSRPLTLQQLRGKYVLLDFWGYWCGPCLRATPRLMALHEAFSDRGLVVIGIHDASVNSIAEMNERLARTKTNLWMGHDIKYPLVLDAPETS